MNRKEAKALATFLNWLFSVESWHAVPNEDYNDQTVWAVLRYQKHHVDIVANRYTFWLFLSNNWHDPFDSMSMTRKEAKRTANVLNWLLHERGWHMEHFEGRGETFVAAKRTDTYSGGLLDEIEIQFNAIRTLRKYFEHENPLEYENPNEDWVVSPRHTKEPPIES